MSYIRSTSNPEGLYIWHDVNGPVIVTTQTRDGRLPLEVFEGIMRRWGRDPFLYVYDDEGLTFKGATMKVNKRNWKWQLNYTGWEKPVECYQVTWEHVARNVLRRRRK